MEDTCAHIGFCCMTRDVEEVKDNKQWMAKEGAMQKITEEVEGKRMLITHSYQ